MRYEPKHRAPAASHRRLVLAAATAAVSAVPVIAAVAPADAATDATWDRLAGCESSGRWSVNTGNGYFGGLQFTSQTWRGFGGGQYAASAHLATRDEQIVVAERVLARQGWGAWPTCSRKLGLDARDARAGRSSDRPAIARSAPRAAAAAGSTYVVRTGDTLSGIALRLGVPGGWTALWAANKAAIGPKPNYLRVGTRLAIPGRATMPAKPVAARPGTTAPRPGIAVQGRYTVQRGDTLSRIALRAHVTGGWRALWQANRDTIGANPNFLRVGTHLRLP